MRKYNTLAGILPCLRDVWSRRLTNSFEGSTAKPPSDMQQPKFVTGRAKAKYFRRHKATTDLCRNT